MCPKPAYTKYFIGWFVPGVLCTMAAIIAYYPSLDRCYGTRDLEWSLLFLLIFLPLVLVVIINPILFYTVSVNIRKQMIMHAGKYTQSERELLMNVKTKLVFIVIVFFFCWFPNITAAILEGLPGEDASFFDVLQDLWIVMALCNPLQAVLNCLAYYGWPGWKAPFDALKSFLCRSTEVEEEPSALFSSLKDDKEEETAPILSIRRNSTFYTD